mmetsp:Transcript_2116/g.8189  ORF Transcript_2116/g.8189 Transcript_2116/m.8189 type:complete len:104 (+) Transcript_2116:195-506(+)|eukprot:CAMPEP_0185695516 /NCGR_PEP_ID=MMETSP1164-20130828/4569_1 /TAXON_ID=1104430 /ORGANISM="Chrysoreinhardia sp, Strain CCMP2950" /LENGTH=103 /DNA_ID=CAMNT_0028362375 /DNA_START=69 /DNA_END=380 /DNA_ORIENTATION=-
MFARVAALACFVVVSVTAFVPMTHTPLATRAASRSAPVASMTPVDVAPAAMDLVSTLPTQLVSLEVTTAAFLAVLLGTFFPVFFLITLYIQSEGYKAGNPDEF